MKLRILLNLNQKKTQDKQFLAHLLVKFYRNFKTVLTFTGYIQTKKHLAWTGSIYSYCLRFIINLKQYEYIDSVQAKCLFVCMYPVNVKTVLNLR